MVTHQLQVERRTAKGHRPKTDALPLDHTTSVPLRSVEGVLRSRQWWKTNSARYSLLSSSSNPLALKYLCIPGSLTPPERTFSVAGLALNRLRSAFSPEHVDMLVVRPVHANTDLLG